MFSISLFDSKQSDTKKCVCSIKTGKQHQHTLYWLCMKASIYSSFVVPLPCEMYCEPYFSVKQAILVKMSDSVALLDDLSEA